VSTYKQILSGFKIRFSVPKHYQQIVKRKGLGNKLEFTEAVKEKIIIRTNNPLPPGLMKMGFRQFLVWYFEIDIMERNDGCTVGIGVQLLQHQDGAVAVAGPNDLISKSSSDHSKYWGNEAVSMVYSSDGRFSTLDMDNLEPSESKENKLENLGFGDIFGKGDSVGCGYFQCIQEQRHGIFITQKDKFIGICFQESEISAEELEAIDVFPIVMSNDKSYIIARFTQKEHYYDLSLVARRL